MLSPDHLSQITDPANWLDNPLAKREARRDLKRKQPFKAYAWMLGTLSLCFGAALWFLTFMCNSGRGIPWYLGGSFGTALCVSVCGVHSWFISGASRKHTTFLILREAQRNTLPGLLTLPLAPFQLLFQTGLYPWVAAMRMALAGLPFYLFCIAAGGFSWLDLILLYLTFGLLALGFANWNRPILNSMSAFPVIALTNKGNTTAAAMGGEAQTPAQNTNAAGQQNNGGVVGLAAFIPMLIMLFLIPTLARGGIRGVYSLFLQYMPDSIIQLAPTFLFSWPLMMARALITPFDWFGWNVIPLPFILASYVMGRYLALVRSSEYMSVGTYRDLARQRTYVNRRKWEQWTRTAQMFVIVGYAWKWAIVDGNIGGVAPRGVASSDAPLATFLYFIIIIGILRFLGRIRSLASWRLAESLPKKAGALIVNKLPGRSVPVYLLSPPLIAAGFYLACCLLSRTFPFPPSVLPFVGHMLAIGAGAAVIQYAIMRVIGLSPVLPGLCVFALVCFGPPEAGVAAVVSPMLGLLAQGSPGLLGWFRFGAAPPPGLLALYTHAPPWWAWTLACSAIGVLLLVWIPAARSIRPREEAADTSAGESSAEVITVDPTEMGPEVYWDSIFEKKDKDAKSESPAGVQLLAFASRLTDNAIATKEMRSRLRGKLSPNFLRFTMIAFTVVTVGLFSAPGFTAAFGGGLASLLFGPLTSLAAQTAGSILALCYMLLFWLAFSAGIGITPQAIAPEREKSTLGFLLMTPMRNASIIFGKGFGLLVSAGVSSGLVALATLLLSLLFSPTLGPALALTVWLRCIVVSLILMVSVGMVGLGIATIFPRSVSQAGCGGLMYGLLIQVPVQLLMHLSRNMIGRGGGGGGPSLLDNGTFWLYFVGISFGVVILGFLASLFGLWRLRKGDIAFESSKQEN